MSKQTEKYELARAGVTYSLICAGLGVLVAGVLTAILLAPFGSGLVDILPHPYFRSPIAAALISLAIAAWILGRAVGIIIWRVGPASKWVYPLGILLALTCLLISVVAAFTTHFFVSRQELGDFNDYIVGPALGIVGFGFLPALILGLVFSIMIRSAESTS